MYPHLYSQSSTPYKQPSSNVSGSSNRRSLYPQPPADDRKYHTPTDQLMIGFDKFIRRYESKFCSNITILR